MTLQDVGRALRERRVAVIVSILVALVAGGALFLVRPATYTATLTVYAAPRATDPASPEAAYQGNLLAKDRIPSYVQLVTSPQVVSEAIARGQLPTDVDDLTARVTATNALDSVLVDVAVDAPSAAEAVTTANAFADVLPPAVAQIEQSGLPGAQPAVSLRVIRPVPVPTRPSTPGLGLTLLVALLAGVLVGLAVALVRDALDRSVRTPEDLADALARAGRPEPAPPVLASLPAVDAREPALAGPRSGDAEAYRQLRTALHSGRHAAPGVLAITSPGSGEGRTTVTCNLAAAAAAAGLGVVVVDADLRRPMVADTLDVSPGTGLTDVLSGRVDVDAAVRSTRAGFDVVPTGSLPSNPSELLAGGGLGDILAALHTRYDLVLVDTPPTLPVTDAAVVAEAADGVVVLVRTRRTRPADLARALRTLDAADATVVGTVLVGATGGPTLPADQGARSAIVPRAVRAGSTRAERPANERPAGREAGTDVPRPAAAGPMPEPRPAEPRPAEPRPAEPRPAEPRTTRTRREDGRPLEVRPAGPGSSGPPPAPVGPLVPSAPAAPLAPASGGARPAQSPEVRSSSASRHGRSADATAAAPRATGAAAPRGGPGTVPDEAPTLTGSRGAGQRNRNGNVGGDRPANGSRSNGGAVPAASGGGSRERNGHSQNGHSQNGHEDPGFGFGFGADGAPARGNGSASRHGRPDPDPPRRGR